MKTIALAVPVLAAALLATAACTKTNDAGSNTTNSYVAATEEGGFDANGVDPAVNTADLLSNEASVTSNTSLPLGNAQ
ncbi:hypothetical protein AB5I39_10130 [Sphingomonas sp. MMS24-J45]|uniref:hypothetical protein n=1 Tax=Sphingomonas sp. MMS24-J45 TaxID=3238806 RepID=UPI00384C1592